MAGMNNQSTQNPFVHIASDSNKSHLISGAIEEVQDVTTWRRKCGCARTSEKLKHILGTFPTPPPPSPAAVFPMDRTYYGGPEFYTYHDGLVDKMYVPSIDKTSSRDKRRHYHTSKSWQVVAELVQLVQLSITATALALYYLIYCYMQLVYYTLRSALYFHNADGPMKITIGVVTLTSLIVGFNMMLRMERVLGILY